MATCSRHWGARETRRAAPCLTRSSVPAAPLGPSFSLRAHSVSSATVH
jgi:hypothetical protein